MGGTRTPAGPWSSRCRSQVGRRGNAGSGQRPGPTDAPPCLGCRGRGCRQSWLVPCKGPRAFMSRLAAGGTALSMNWKEVGKQDYSKRGNKGDDVDSDWHADER